LNAITPNHITAQINQAIKVKPMPDNQALQTVDTELAPLRVQIDALDTQLITLLNERAKLAQAVGHVKQKYKP
jgi:recombinational DNA repair ATPase RecF